MLTERNYFNKTTFSKIKDNHNTLKFSPLQDVQFMDSFPHAGWLSVRLFV